MQDRISDGEEDCPEVVRLATLDPNFLHKSYTQAPCDRTDDFTNSTLKTSERNFKSSKQVRTHTHSTTQSNDCSIDTRFHVRLSSQEPVDEPQALARHTSSSIDFDNDEASTPEPPDASAFSNDSPPPRPLSASPTTSPTLAHYRGTTRPKVLLDMKHTPSFRCAMGIFKIDLCTCAHVRARVERVLFTSLL